MLPQARGWDYVEIFLVWLTLPGCWEHRSIQACSRSVDPAIAGDTTGLQWARVIDWAKTDSCQAHDFSASLTCQPF